MAHETYQMNVSVGKFCLKSDIWVYNINTVKHRYNTVQFMMLHTALR